MRAEGWPRAHVLVVFIEMVERLPLKGLLIFDVSGSSPLGAGGLKGLLSERCLLMHKERVSRRGAEFAESFSVKLSRAVFVYNVFKFLIKSW